MVHDCPATLEDFATLVSAVLARISPSGDVREANEGFRRLVPAPTGDASMWSITPALVSPLLPELLARRDQGDQRVVYEGVLRLRPGAGDVLTLRGRVVRDGPDLILIAERDTGTSEQRLRDQSVMIERLRQEVATLERIVGQGRSTIAAESLGLKDLRESSAAVFHKLADELGHLLDQALEQRGFRTDLHLSERLRDLADRVGQFGGGPRDVIDLYRAALHGRRRGVASEKGRAYIEEGRLLVLELMGNLVSYYRRYARPPHPARDAGPVRPPAAGPQGASAAAAPPGDGPPP